MLPRYSEFWDWVPSYSQLRNKNLLCRRSVNLFLYFSNLVSSVVHSAGHFSTRSRFPKLREWLFFFVVQNSIAIMFPRIWIKNPMMMRLTANLFTRGVLECFLAQAANCVVSGFILSSFNPFRLSNTQYTSKTTPNKSKHRPIIFNRYWRFVFKKLKMCSQFILGFSD